MSQKNQIKSTSVKNEAMSTTVLQDGLDKLFKSGYSLIDLNHAEVQKLGLPHTACTGNHYIKAHLFVTDSGTVTGLPAHRIGQTLVFTPCNDGNTEIYTRTGEISGENIKWGRWEKLATATELAQALEQFKPTGAEAVEWGVDSCINTFVEQGTYNITGERLNVADGLPIDNSNPGHTFSARLVVLDSSITGNGDARDKCVTQLLTLSNRTGGDGEIYIRTGSAVSKNALIGGAGWEPWGKLQQNIGVGQVTSLNNYIDNGMYSGVYTDGSTFFETFVMVVINNYALAGKTGRVRSVSQFKYTLNIDGTFSYKTRTGQGNTGIAWGDWVDIGAATTADIQDNSITAQKLCVDVREKVNNPLRPLYVAAGAEYNDSGADITKTAPWGETVTHKAGHYYLNGLGDITEEQMDVIFTSTFSTYVATNLMSAFRIHVGGEWRVRTNLRKKTVYPICYTDELGAFCYTNSTIEVLVISHYPESLEKPTNLEYAFNRCVNLKAVIGNIIVDKINIQTFQNCAKLQEVKLKELLKSITLADSLLISKESIFYIISNATPTTAITITLHPDAYARLADDADIVAALEAQPLVSLVSA